MKRFELNRLCSPIATAVRVAIGMATAVLGSTTHAQILVTDTAAIAQNTAATAQSYAEQVLQYAKQVEQYTTQLQQYAQLLSSIPGLVTGFSLVPNILQHADAGSLIQMNCPGASAVGGLDTIMSSLSSLLGQSITASQKQICAQIVTIQVDKYNRTVDVLNKMNTYNSTFTQVQSVANSISTLADSGRASNQASTYNNALATEMANWASQMKAEDDLIKTLEAQQSMLAKAALNGRGTPLGNVTQAAAFATAFSR